MALPNLLKIIGKGDEEKENFRKSLNECLDPRKTKMIVEFNDHESSSIKSFAVKKRDMIKVTSQFMSVLTYVCKTFIKKFHL